MSSQLQVPDKLATPWQAPSPNHSPLHHHLPTTSWHVRKPLVAGDLQSTSTVTTSPSQSSSSTSSPQPSNSPSPLSTSNQPPTTWQLDNPHSHSITPPTTPPHQPNSVRALPRCGVVNFRKDGDSLRWAPRVTQNSSGVAARVHNFEDAFSLEEFSSKALPGVWRTTGGNPRLSDLTKPDNPRSRRIPLRAPRSASTNSETPPLPPPPPPPKRSARTMEKIPKSIGHSQRALARNSSVKKAVVLATEVHRPSFWSIIAHTSKYQRSKAKAARLQNDAKKRSDNTTKRPALRLSPDPCVLSAVPKEAVADATYSDPFTPQQPWAKLSRRKSLRSGRGGKATKRAPDSSDKKGSSLFQRLLAHLDRRNTKKPSFPDTTRTESMDRHRMLFSKNDGMSGSDSDEKPMYSERSKGLFKQVGRHSADGGSSRRVVSALAGNLASRRTPQRREFPRVASHDDQYVTFITSES